MIPEPSTYVRASFPPSFSSQVLTFTPGSVLSHIGVNGGAVGQPHISTPYHGHAPVQVRRPSLSLSLRAKTERLVLRSGLLTTSARTDTGSTSTGSCMWIFASVCSGSRRGRRRSFRSWRFVPCNEVIYQHLAFSPAPLLFDKEKGWKAPRRTAFFVSTISTWLLATPTVTSQALAAPSPRPRRRQDHLQPPSPPRPLRPVRNALALLSPRSPRLTMSSLRETGLEFRPARAAQISLRLAA